MKRSVAVSLVLLATLAGGSAAAQDWAARQEGERFAAGMVSADAFAGLRFECVAPGEVATVLSHNGAVFDRARDHTVVVSVDGLATVLTMRAAPGADGSAAGDSFRREDRLAEVAPLLDALAKGSGAEVSAPSGRYRIGLAGSGRAIAALRERCGG